MRNVLITNAEVIFHAPTQQTLDPRTIQNSIIIAEERFIRPALGDALYIDLVTKKNNAVTDGNKTDLQTKAGSAVTLKTGDILNAWELLSADYQDLWKQYLWKLTAEAVMIVAIPEAFVQFSSAGVIHGAPPAGPMTTTGVVSPDLKSVKWARDTKLMDRVDPLREAMHSFLCANKGKYPLYKKPCDCNADGVAFKRKSDFILGIYDDDDQNYDCND